MYCSSLLSFLLSVQGEVGIDRADVSSTLLPTPRDRLNLKCTVGGAEHLRNWGGGGGISLCENLIRSVTS